jgi:hypothetical protein
MSELDKYSVEELEKEIRKRLKGPDLLPEEEINMSELKNAVINYIDYIKEQQVQSEDSKQYIFEIALKTFYGSKIFEWVNSVTL